jgi:hypothetical protein
MLPNSVRIERSMSAADSVNERGPGTVAQAPSHRATSKTQIVRIPAPDRVCRLPTRELPRPLTATTLVGAARGSAPASRRPPPLAELVDLEHAIERLQLL